MTRVINFTAGPSAGKTTNGLLLAGMMKRARMNVLYIPEFALELIASDREKELDDQIYVFGEQFHRLYSAMGKFDYIVTDAPLFHTVHYAQFNLKKLGPTEAREHTITFLEALTITLFRQFDNVTFFVDRRDRKFVQAGRIHNEEQSKEIDKDIRLLLEEWSIPYTTVYSAEEAFKRLFPDADIPTLQDPSLSEPIKYRQFVYGDPVGPGSDDPGGG